MSPNSLPSTAPRSAAEFDTSFAGRPARQERPRRALVLAKRAVHLDPLDSRSHLSLAWSFAMTDGSIGGARVRAAMIERE